MSFFCSFLQSVLLLELQVLLVERVDSVDHRLDELDLGVTETVLVGDVVGGAWSKKRQSFTNNLFMKIKNNVFLLAWTLHILP
jgi:hypothetical protein